jgi:hypothetical protein
MPRSASSVYSVSMVEARPSQPAVKWLSRTASVEAARQPPRTPWDLCNGVEWQVVALPQQRAAGCDVQGLQLSVPAVGDGAAQELIGGVQPAHHVDEHLPVASGVGHAEARAQETDFMTIAPSLCGDGALVAGAPEKRRCALSATHLARGLVTLNVAVPLPASVTAGVMGAYMIGMKTKG